MVPTMIAASAALREGRDVRLLFPPFSAAAVERKQQFKIELPRAFRPHLNLFGFKGAETAPGGDAAGSSAGSNPIIRAMAASTANGSAPAIICPVSARGQLGPFPPLP